MRAWQGFVPQPTVLQGSGMPRRRSPDLESLSLWVRGLPEWKKRILTILLDSKVPLTTGEIAERIDYRATLTAIHHYLTRLEAHGIVRGFRVFMSRKRAWMLTDQARDLFRKIFSDDQK